jgi:glycosyltransferase involved in cell wall biosynthesis
VRIGIDAVPLKRQRTGIGNYIYNLVELLPQVAPEHEYFLYSNRKESVASFADPFQARIDEAFRRLPGSFWLLGRCGGLARKDKVDVFWATGTVLPPFLPADTLKIITVYDMVWQLYPETTTSYNLFIQKVCTRKAVAEADLIVVISQTTQDALVASLGVPREKTRLVYPGISQRYKPHDPKKAAEYIASKYGVPSRYMATVGTIEPRKNLRLLIGVLQILKEKAPGCPLLVVGAKGWKNSDLFREIQASGLTEKEIRFLGYMSDEDMPFFYSGAQVFSFPTLYEGFGLPPVEAMACGSPVVASNADCMPEVLGDAAILESPSDAAGFATAIANVLTDDSLRDAMRARGICRAQRYRPDASARRLLEVFEEAILREVRA